MKSIAHLNSQFFLYFSVCLFALLASSGDSNAAKKDNKESATIAPSQAGVSVESAVHAESECGGMIFDRNSGRMIPRPNVDLVVKHLEIINTERGTWVMPTIRNMCPGRVSENIHVSIGDVVVTFAGIPPSTDYSLGYAVGVPTAAEYTVIVDYDRRINESNERNNHCTRSTTGNCR